jgi:hypothetical protein
MKVIQIVPTLGQNCGVAFFAAALHEQMEKIGIEVKDHPMLKGNMPAADIILLHHHSDLLDNEDVQRLCARNRCPVVLFAHSDGIDMLYNVVDGFAAMCPGMIPETERPTHVFPHPAWIPEGLEDRAILRESFKLPIKSRIIGTNGFLKFERQFVEILTELLPQAKDNDWFVNLITSPWYKDSPGLESQLEKLQSAYSSCFRFENSYWDRKTLNQKLQACDLLWCWTRAASSPYASGVISDQYASGTRIFAADKLQHHHALELPNVIRGPNKLEPFIEQLIEEIKRGICQRHDPSPLSWDRCIYHLTAFLARVYS